MESLAGHPAIAVLLPSSERELIAEELREGGFDPIVVHGIDELEGVLATRRDVVVAVIDVESDPDEGLRCWALLHDRGRRAAAAERGGIDAGARRNGGNFDQQVHGGKVSRGEQVEAIDVRFRRRRVFAELRRLQSALRRFGSLPGAVSGGDVRVGPPHFDEADRLDLDPGR